MVVVRVLGMVSHVFKCRVVKPIKTIIHSYMYINILYIFSFHFVSLFDNTEGGDGGRGGVYYKSSAAAGGNQYDDIQPPINIDEHRPGSGGGSGSGGTTSAEGGSKGGDGGAGVHLFANQIYFGGSILVDGTAGQEGYV